MKNKYIGLLANDSPGLPTGVLAVLKSGNCFVPINPIFPNERVRFIIDDCNISILLTDEANYKKAQQIIGETSSIIHLICIDVITVMEWKGVAVKEKKGEARISIDSPAYVIYTSGSTGKPKGVPIAHQNLVPLFHWFRDYFALGVHTRVMQNLSYTFDFGIFEILTTFLFGGRLYVVNKETIGDFSLYANFINRMQINTLHTTPVFFNNIANSDQKVPFIKLLHLGGERLTGRIIKNAVNVTSPGCLVYNGYGPTEATINCAIFLLAGWEERDNIPIGRPSALHEIYILDMFAGPQPIGVAGELCIAGPGLADGYLNLPELTVEKFIKNKSFSGGSGTPQRGEPIKNDFLPLTPDSRLLIPKLYRTGDLARWLSDGNIEFLGRIDQQVKVRGFRIELGEIENDLARHPGIKEAVVIARQHENGSNYLCAYIVIHGGESLTTSQLREYLTRELPDYMIPAYFIHLESIPLTGTGKVDRNALRGSDVTFIETGVEYVAPGSETEKRLVSVWQQLLKLERIGINDDFFQLGGDSILVNRCIARIREELQVEIPLRKFFEQPYVKTLAKEIEKQEQQVSSLKPVERIGEIPLSFAQERLWFLQELDADNVAYFVPRVIRMKGKLDISIIERTFTEIIRRHEILRTVFPTIDGQPVQRIQLPYAFKIPTLDWSQMEEMEQEQKVSEFLNEEDRRPFDFEKGPMLRVTILKLKEEEHLFVLTEHHLVHDGWTQGVLLREFIAIFRGYIDGKEHRLPQLPIQYADFAIWQRNHLTGDVLERHLAYWKEKLAGLAPVLELPADRPRPAVISGQGALEEFHVSSFFTHTLKEFSRKNGVTLFMAMLAVFKSLLYRYTGVEDLCVGTGIANRKYQEMEGMLGMVINTLPLRTQVDGEISFKECLNRVKETCLEAYQHEDTPFGKIVEKLQPERSLSYSPIFQVMFTFMDTPGGELRLPGLELELLPAHNRSAKFDINVVVVPPQEQETGETGEILVEWEYNTDIFDPPAIGRMVSHYNRLLEEGLGHPETDLSSLPLLSDVEMKQVLYEFNDPERVYPREKTIHELFAEQVQKTTDCIALVGADHGGCPVLSVRPVRPVRLSYHELNEQSGRLAGLLIEKGVLAGDIVGIMMERSIDLIIGIMGILKAEAAYLPIDADLPGERINYMLKDSGAKILINKSEIPNSKFETNPNNKNMNNQNKNFRIPFVLNFEFVSDLGFRISNFNSSNLAYIIYTSGSTGIPKGVPITHTNLCPLLYWGYDYMDWGAGDHIIQTLAYYFDWSAWEIFLAITSGACLYMISEEILLSPEAQLDFIRKNDITVMETTPTRFHSLLSMNPKQRALDTLRCLCIGAEKLTVNLVKRVRELIVDDCRIFNLYGPTEATIISGALKIDMANMEKYDCLSSVPIGNPVGNSPLLVLDKNLNNCPINVTGELYIAGDGVAMGYLNDPFKSSHSFIENRFQRQRISGDRLYKTGDLARWLAGGTVEFLGRIDNQVKIRGLRIELGEIESRLLKHAAINEAVVIEKSRHRGDNYLCAYIVVSAGKTISAVQVKEYLSGVLPDYMIPSFFMFIDKIPINPNGKIDRKALPEPRVSKTTKEFIAPRDAVERKLEEIWTEVLKPGSGIGIDENFFDLGGHSLNSTLLTARMHKVFNIKIALKEFFQRGCIREVAEYLKGAIKNEFIVIEPVEEKEYYPLSAAQKRMYILQQMDEAGVVYNISAVMTLEGVLDIGYLEKIFIKIIQRHDSLRTSFTTINEEPVQRIHEHVEFEIEYKKSSTDYTNYTNEKDNYIHHFIQPFELSRAPLLRVALVKEEDEKHLFLLDMHHIVTDGTSMELFVNEFMALYAGKELPSLKLQYKDYSAWRYSEQKKNALKEQEGYWLALFSEVPVALELPLDYPRPVVQSFEGRGYSFELSAAETYSLKALASEEGTTLYMVLLGLYYIFLSRLTGQEDIVVGTPVADRSHADLEPIIGMFVNTLALRNYPVWDKNFSEFLKEVNENTLTAFTNQDYPYEELVEKAAVERDIGRNPLFDTLLNLRNMDISEIAIPGLKMTSFPFEENISKFDLTLRVFDAPSNLRFTFEYCTKLFKAETIERFAGFFRAVIAQVIHEPRVYIAAIEIISEAEKKKILMDFNGTTVEYPCDKTIHQLFEGQVEKAPDRIAVIGLTVAETLRATSLQITYRQLNEKSNRLAYLLKEKGVLADDLVGIMMERSIDLIVGIMGILKSGGAYLPIDTDYPQERIDYMLADSNVKIIVGNRHACSEKLNCQLKIVNCELLMSAPGAPFHHSSSIIHHSSHLAYIMYTSGSTGQPKGVMVTHRNVVRLVKNTNFVPLTEETRILQTGAPVFDATTFEIWGSLLNGGQLVLVDKEVILDAHRLGDVLKGQRINTLWLSAPLFNQLIQENIGLFTLLHYLLVGGDVLSPEHINRVRFKFPGMKIINGYGPTENTTFSVTFLIEKEFEHSVPIGRPIANSTAYIYDKCNRLAPIGVVGELYVGGDGIARGYLNNPELTAEKFDQGLWDYQDEKNKSFAGGPGGRFYKKAPLVYKTGDLARYLLDGNIEFLGRIDQQVKIRGFRIELGEIENRLLMHDAVKEAVVVCRESKDGDKYLCAYIVGQEAEFREYLLKTLPDYMTPSYFIVIDKIPLTSNGKVDKKMLPEPRAEKIAAYNAPRNTVEKTLVEIWSKVLAVEKEKIGIDTPFFQLGGHSLKATIMISRIHKALNVAIPLAEIFKRQTIRLLAEFIKSAQKSTFRDIEPVEKKEYYELSYNQKRLWIIRQLDPVDTSYNMVGYFLMSHYVDVETVRKSLVRITEKHESFRTYFKEKDGDPFQFIENNVEIPLEVIDISTLKNEEKELEIKTIIERERKNHFDLARVPLFRVKLVKQEKNYWYFIFNMHHIISDGWSYEILEKDFRHFYEIYRAGQEAHTDILPLQYKDFAAWQNCLIQSPGLKEKAHRFWTNKLKKGFTQFYLPGDFARTKSNSTAAVYRAVVNNEIKDRLRCLAADNNTTLFIVMFSVFNWLLARYSGRKDIVCGIISAGREHVGLQDIVGFFINSLLSKIEVSPEEEFDQFLRRMDMEIMELFQYQSYPLELILDELKMPYPEISVCFNMLNMQETSLEKELEAIEPEHMEALGKAKFDLVLYAIEYKNGIELNWNYRDSLLKSRTMEILAGGYLELLGVVTFAGEKDESDLE